MFLNSKHLKNKKGFTLVELMTTVAIVGALAAIGVPQYRKIQRKAKRAEATMALGVIASAEAAFFAEYDGYGTSMGGIGAELEQAPQNYTTGFLAASCAVAETGANMVFCQRGMACAANSNPPNFPGYTTAQIFSPSPANLTGSAANRVVSGFSALQPGTTANTLVAMYAVNGCPATLAVGGATPVLTLLSPNNSGVSAIAHNGFKATAAGNLYQRAHTTADPVQGDIVTIDNQRVIRVVQDGT